MSTNFTLILYPLMDTWIKPFVSFTRNLSVMQENLKLPKTNLVTAIEELVAVHS